MSYGTVQAEKMTTESGYSLGAGNASSFKNKLINGAMSIAQRGTSFTGIKAGNTSAFPADRFRGFNADTIGVYSFAQLADAPAGFINSIRAQVTTADATPDQESYIEQIIEGNNCLGLAYGTSAAAPITVSFWVKASVAGIYNVWLFAEPAAKSVGSSYTITSANTWQFVSMTFSGDTVSALSSGNTAGIYVRWYLDAVNASIGPLNSTWTALNTNRMVSGSVRLLSTLNATFQITGCQVEVGTVATSFDFRSIGTELALCQRYAYRHSAEGDIDSFAPLGIGRYYGTNTAQLYVPFKVTMRTSPTSVTQIGNIAVNDATFNAFAITLAINETSSTGATVVGTTTSGTTAGTATTFYANGTSSAALIFSAEL